MVATKVNPPGFTRAVQADPDLRGTTVVVLSTVGQHRTADWIRDLGIFASLTKPVRQSQLLNTLAAAWAARTEAGAEPIAVERRTRKLPAPAVPVFSGHSPRVLIAEDNVVNQRIVSRLLQSIGCKVDGVANGKEALKAIAGVAYDLVLMDVEMPEMDGLAATFELRRPGNERSTVPIVAMTDSTMQGDREKCLSAGMNDYVTKPVHRADLERVLRQWIPVRPPGA